MNLKGILIFLNLVLITTVSFAVFTFSNVNAVSLTSAESKKIIKNESNITINAVLDEALEYGKEYAINKFTVDGFNGEELPSDMPIEYDGSGFLYGDQSSTISDIETGKIININNAKFDNGSTTVGEVKKVLANMK